jgi:hypothetical protein
MDSSQTADALAASFFDLIRRPQLDEAEVMATVQQIRGACPEVSSFSFEFVDDEGEELARAEGESTPRLSVEVGTPASTVDAWNSVKLVGLFELDCDVCGAAIGNVKAGCPDFKACVLPAEGDDGCPFATHKARSAVKVEFPTAGVNLHVPVPSSATRPAQVFSRPFLTADDLVYMGPKTVGYRRLKALMMEPRCWKFIIEHFPGAEALRDPSQPPSSYLQAQQSAGGGSEIPYEQFLPPARAIDASTAGLDEVTDQPITSPRASGLPFSQQQQEASITSWGDNSAAASVARSIERSMRSRTSRDPEEEGGPNVGAVRRDRARDRRNVRRVEEEVPSDLSSDESDEFGNITSFRQVGRILKQMQIKHDKAENKLKLRLLAAEDKARDLQEKLDDATFDLPTAEVLRSQIEKLDDATFRSVVDKVFELLKKDPTYIDRSDLIAATATPSSDQELVRRLEDVERDLFHSAGTVPQLLSRLEHLETSRSATAVELGGYVFSDDGAVDAWLKPLNDPNVNRFCVDFVILLLMAEPRFETVSKGLEQTAAVKKAQFESLDVATIDLSYKITYPPRILQSSERESAMDNDNVEWATPFATHSAFEGTYNNGTHLRLKKAINGVVKAIEGGLDSAYPPRLHPKINAVFKDQLRLTADQCLGFLDSCIPLFRKISGGGMEEKEAWTRVLVFVKQVFDDIAVVRAVNSEATLGSKVWASFVTANMLRGYQTNNWVEHPKTSSILALTAMRKEGRALQQMMATLGSHTSTLQSHTTDIKKLKEDMKKKSTP